MYSHTYSREQTAPPQERQALCKFHEFPAVLNWHGAQHAIIKLTEISDYFVNETIENNLTVHSKFPITLV